ncbi:MAG: choice-of-anchor tandem repeat GloVer-containing protein [Terriglobales bacterium]
MNSMLRGALMLALASVILVAARAARAQMEGVVYSFCSQPNCADGFGPNGNLLLDAQGNLFGATQYGGAHNQGVIFKLAPSGAESVLRNFSYGIGAQPEGSLIQDAQGNLYGVTNGSGYIGLLNANFFGSVFELKKRSYRFLYRYTASNQTTGAKPSAGLVMDAQGNVYGTTEYGGANGCGTGYGCGTVFKVTPSGVYTVLHNFAGGLDGEGPNGNLVLDASGNLYGTTDFGGPYGQGCLEAAGCGTVFKLAADGTEMILYSFSGEADGGRPLAGLIMDEQGNLYGTTAEGGTGCPGEGSVGCGTVFKLTPSGNETVLYSFAGGNDGDGPWSTLVRDGQGNFYGTTFFGGGSGCTGDGGCGTVFKVSPGGTETVLYRFTGGTDGARPYGGVVLDAAGNIYGTTFEGGLGQCDEDLGCGVVFKVTP